MIKQHVRNELTPGKKEYQILSDRTVVLTNCISKWQGVGHRSFGREVQRIGGTHIMCEDDRSIAVMDAVYSDRLRKFLVSQTGANEC